MCGDCLAASTPAVILSGGLSERLGQPKAMVKVHDKAILTITVEKLQSVGCDPIIIVVNRNIQFDALLNSNGATVVVNKTPETGRTGSLKLGLNTIIAELGRVPNKLVMVPIDRPGWKANHLRQLLTQPMSSCLAEGGKRGHPVLLVKNNLLDILSASDDAVLRELIHFDSVEITGGLLSLNLDTPADLVELAKNSAFFTEL